MCVPGTHRGQRRSPEVELDDCELLLSTENEPNSFRREASVLNRLIMCRFSEFFLPLSERTLRLELMKSCLCAGNIPTAFYSKHTNKLVTE